MKNDSTHEEKVTPAPDGALALPTGDNSETTGTENGALVPFYHVDGARALRQERLCIDRILGMESIVVDGIRYFRDIDLAKSLEFSRLRNIRRTIMKLIKSREISENQFIVIDDDDSGQVFYLDKEASLKLASNTKGITEKMIMSTLSMVSSPVEKTRAPISEEKALNGYTRTLAYISKKDTPRAAKLAAEPALEKYARAAGIQPPDLSELIGLEQPRLPGV